MNTNEMILRQTPGDGFIRVFNQGAFVANFAIAYFIDGKFYRVVSPQISVLQTQTLTIPYNATNIQLGIAVAVYWQSWRTIYRQSFNTPPKKCYRLYGVTFYAGCEEVSCNSLDNGILPDPPTINPNCCCCCKPQCRTF